MPRIERRDDAVLQALTAWPKLLRFSGGSAPSALHQLGDATLLAERLDPHLFELGKIARGRDGVDQLGLESIELWLRHGKGSCPADSRKRGQAPRCGGGGLDQTLEGCGS